MDFTKGKFEKMFPHLAAELEKNVMKVSIDSVRSDIDAQERTATQRKFTSYNPDILDFLRRCSTRKEGKEIIDFMEKRVEISHEYANKLRAQLSEKGIRSFGTKKGENYYFHYFKRIEKVRK